MTKQDFELIARVLRESRAKYGPASADAATIDLLAQEFATELRATNGRFDRSRFLAACMGEDSTDSAGRRVRYSNA